MQVESGGPGLPSQITVPQEVDPELTISVMRDGSAVLKHMLAGWRTSSSAASATQEHLWGFGILPHYQVGSGHYQVKPQLSMHSEIMYLQCVGSLTAAQ